MKNWMWRLVPLFVMAIFALVLFFSTNGCTRDIEKQTRSQQSNVVIEVPWYEDKRELLGMANGSSQYGTKLTYVLILRLDRIIELLEREERR